MRATLVENNCRPSCSQGKNQRTAVTIRMDRRVNREATQTYRRMTVCIVGSVPKGMSRLSTCRLSRNGPVFVSSHTWPRVP